MPSFFEFARTLEVLHYQHQSTIQALQSVGLMDDVRQVNAELDGMSVCVVVFVFCVLFVTFRTYAFRFLPYCCA